MICFFCRFCVELSHGKTGFFGNGRVSLLWWSFAEYLFSLQRRKQRLVSFTNRNFDSNCATRLTLATQQLLRLTTTCKVVNSTAHAIWRVFLTRIQRFARFMFDILISNRTFVVFISTFVLFAAAFVFQGNIRFT